MVFESCQTGLDPRLRADGTRASGTDPLSVVEERIVEVEQEVDALAQQLTNALQDKRDSDHTNTILMALLAQAEADIAGLKKRLRTNLATTEALKWCVTSALDCQAITMSFFLPRSVGK